MEADERIDGEVFWMEQWVKVCDLAGAPEEGKVMEAEAAGLEICTGAGER